MKTASLTGDIHLIFASLSLIFGAYVLFAPKGNRVHIFTGYIYFFCMLITLITSFMIYRLFDGFGMFHWMAIISAIALAGGIFPAILRKPKDGWFELHFNFMYWSVAGLYGAFISEILTRSRFKPSLGLLVLVLGIFFSLASNTPCTAHNKKTQSFHSGFFSH